MSLACTASPSFAPGSLLGEHLVVTSVLGEGGTATVYEAHHRRLSVQTAVKVCKPADLLSGDDGKARLSREAHVYDTVRDPRLPRVYDVGELDDGTAFMVMEKLEGSTLAAELARGPLAVDVAIELALELLDLLDVVHAHGIVHRDVKPQNVLIDRMRTPHVRLIDFGVCKLSKLAPEITSITRCGEIVGTPAYMAPEQLTGQPVDGRVDVHAVGAVLYEALTGQPAYRGDSFGEVVAAILRDEPTSLCAVRTDVSPAVAAVVTRALAKAPSARFRTAGAMREALAAAWAEPHPQTCGRRAQHEHALPRPPRRMSGSSGSSPSDAKVGHADEGEIMRKIHIGLSEEQRQGSVQALNTVLCDESLLLIKTKKAHWDVVGPQFLTLHKLLDEHYEKVSDYVDSTAERVRSLGGFPIGTAAGFIQGSNLKEEPGELEGATAILSRLLDDHETIIRVLRDLAQRTEALLSDRGTSDFLVAMMQGHEEMAWMLRSFLEGEAVVSDGRVRQPRMVPPLA